MNLSLKIVLDHYCCVTRRVKRATLRYLLFLVLGVISFSGIQADHFWDVRNLTLVETFPGSEMYDILYDYNKDGNSTNRFYWELRLVESGCSASDGFTRDFTGCTLIYQGAFGLNTDQVLATNIPFCNGKTYDAILYTRRRGNCDDDTSLVPPGLGPGGGPNPPTCFDANMLVQPGTNEVYCSDLTCGCPEDRADAFVDATGDLTQFPSIAAGDPTNIWAGAPFDMLGDQPVFDRNWAYVRTTLAGTGVPDFNISMDFEVDDCFGDFNVSFMADQDDGQMISENFGGAVAMVRCGSQVDITYNASNSCGPNFPGNTFEVIDNLGGAFTFGTDQLTDPPGDTIPGVNVGGRFESLNDAVASGFICDTEEFNLTLINATCSAEQITNVNVTYDLDVVYPTSNFAMPTTINCSDPVVQNLILSSGPQWVNTGINTGGSTTLPITDNPDGAFSFTWSGQITNNTTTADACDSGSGGIEVDNCASCGRYEIRYEIVNTNCDNCSTTTVDTVDIIGPIITNVMGGEIGCGDIMPNLSFDVVECDPANPATATTNPYTGPGNLLWERSDNPGVFIPPGPGLLVTSGNTVTFTPHFRNAACTDCNAVGAPVTVVSQGELELTCPVGAGLDLGDFDCSNLATIPALPATIAAAEAAPYNLVIGGDPCGTLSITAMDNGTPDECTSVTQTIQRTITITDSGVLADASDDIVSSCVFFYQITNGFVSPTVQNVPADETIACNVFPTVTTLDFTNGLLNDCLSEGMVTSTLTPHPGNCGGTITETWTIPSADNCMRGDVVTTRTITVDPTPAPTITCPAPVVINGCSSADAPPVDISSVTATALCGAVSVTHEGDMIIAGTGCVGDPIVIMRTYRATTECVPGLFSECTQMISIQDVEDPMITLAASDITVNCTEDVQTLFTSWINNNGGAMASDNCNVIWTTNPAMPVLNMNFVAGPTDIEFIASDACGNSVATMASFRVRCIDIDKPAPMNQDNDMSGDVSVNDVLDYTITVTNTGNVNLTNVVVSDPQITNSPMTCATLLPGGTCVLSGSYTILPTDVTAGMFVNVATGAADDIGDVMDGNTVPINMPSVDFQKLEPVLTGDNDMSLDMSAGDVITYTILAINNGSSVLTNVTISDPELMSTSMPCASLAIGDTCFFTGTYTILPTDIMAGMKMNTATLVTDQTGMETTTQTQPFPSPSVIIDKMTPTLFNDNDNSGDISVGDQLEYVITATNNGTANLTDVIITDNILIPTSETCILLMPTEVCTLTGLYTVVAGDLMLPMQMLVNTATVMTDQTPDGDDMAQIAIPTPQMNFTKVNSSFVDDDDNGEITTNDTIFYTLTANNTGTAVLTDVIINDNTITPSSITCDSLPPGMSCVLNGFYLVQMSDEGNDITNMATADSDQTGPMDATVTISVNAPAVDLVKLPPVLLNDNDMSMDISAGDELQYTIHAINTGSASLSNVLVSDPLLVPNSALCPLVAPMDTCTLIGNYTVVQNDVDLNMIENIATVTTGQNIPPVMDTIIQMINTPSMSIMKSLPTLFLDADGSADFSAGDSIEYVITVTNNGGANLTDIAISDPLLTPSNASCSLVMPGGTCILTGRYLLTQADVDAGQVTNTASASSDQAPPVMTTVVQPLEQPSMSILKTGPVITNDLDGDGMIDDGDELTYTITVTNTSMANLTDIMITDTLLAMPMMTCPGPIMPGGTCILNSTYIATQDDVNDGFITNMATAISDQTPAIMDTVTVMIAGQPSIELTKTAGAITDTNMDGIIGAGDTLIYTFSVQNTGNVTITNIMITDNLIGMVSGAIASLDPMDIGQLTGSYTLTQGDVDLGSRTNMATATGQDPDNNDVADDDMITTPIIQSPSIEVTKLLPIEIDVDSSGDKSINDTLIYTITLVNNGNQTLSGVTISDPLITPNFESCGTLLPMQQCSLTGFYVVQQSDVDAQSIRNQAIGTSNLTPNDTANVEISLLPVSINVVKSDPVLTADNDMSIDISAGDELTYTLWAINDGVATLTDVVIEDPTLTPDMMTCSSVPMGDTCELVGTYIVMQSDVDQGFVTNTATYDADQINEMMVTVDTVLNTPSIDITKGAPVLTGDADGSGDISAGDTLTYNMIIATNIGTANLTDVLVTDPLLDPNSDNCVLIQPMQQCSLIGTYIVTQADVDALMIMNTAFVDSDQTPEDSASFTQVLPEPIIRLEKSGGLLTGDTDGSGDISVGDTLTYTLTVHNDGSANLTNIIITDALLTPSSFTFDNVAAMTSRDTTGIYIVVAGDVGMSIVNNASATSDQIGPDDASTNTAVPIPSMSLTKNPPVLLPAGDLDGSGDLTVGDILTYTITATNTGVSPTGAVLTDVIIEDLLISPSRDTCPVLGLGQTCVLIGTYQVVQADIDNEIINNTATAISDQTPMEMASSSIEPPIPGLMISKGDPIISMDLDNSNDISAGDELTYTIYVENTGTSVLTDVVITDALINPTMITIPSIPVGGIDSLVGSYTVLQGDVDNGSIMNRAFVDTDQTDLDSTDNTVPVPNPQYEIVKNNPTILTDLNNNNFIDAGDVISYAIIVTNTGMANLTDIVILDPLLGVNFTCPIVAPGDVCATMGFYTVPLDSVNAGGIINIATATSDQLPEIRDTVDTEIEPRSEVQLVKLSSGASDTNMDGLVGAGDTIIYNFTVRNTGNVTLTNIDVNDPILGGLLGTIASLMPGDMDNTITGSYTLNQMNVDTGGIANTAIAIGMDPDNMTVIDTSDNGDETVDDDMNGNPGDDPTFTPVDPTPSTMTDKTGPVLNDVDMSEDISVGDILTYTVRTWNTGNITLNNVVVTDNLLMPMSELCVTLAPLDTCTLIGTYEVQQEDVDAEMIQNMGIGDSDETDPDPDIIITPLNVPMLSVDKDPPVLTGDNDGSGDFSVGDEISYTITATNTGTANLTNVNITDNLITPMMADSVILRPGNELVLVGTYTILESDLINGSIMNTAIVTSTQSDSVQDSVEVLLPQPLSTLVKSDPVLVNDPDGSGDFSVGDEIEYTIVFTNTGEANLNGISIMDNLITPNVRVCPTTLMTGDTCQLVGSYTILQSDVDAGSLENIATATSTQAPDVTDTSDIELPIPLLSINKLVPELTGDLDNTFDISPGDILTYTIIAVNTGTATLTGVSISDDRIAPPMIPCPDLAPGDSCVMVGIYIVQEMDMGGPISNTATATSTQVGPVMDSVTVSVPAASMEIVKGSAQLLPINDNDDSQDISVGDLLTYTITATNTGDPVDGGNLSNVIITDPLLTPSTVTCPLLTPLQSCILTGTYEVQPSDVVAGMIVNEAMVTTPRIPGVMMDDDVVMIPQPRMELTKSEPVILLDADLSQDFSVGDLIEYTITANNTGTANLTNLTILDGLLDPESITCPLVLAGDSCVLVGTYTVTENDLITGSITNMATATSTQTPPAMDDQFLDLPQPMLELDKSVPTLITDNDGSMDISAEDVLFYTVKVTNTGTANLSNVVINDPTLIPNQEICDLVIPMDTCVLEGIQIVTQNDVDQGFVTNTAIASTNQTTPEEETETTTIPRPLIMVEKSDPIWTDVDMSGNVSQGDLWEYTITATNIGTANLTNVVVEDPFLDNSTVTCGFVPAAGGTCVLTGTYELTLDNVNAGMFENIATVTTTQSPPDSDTLITDIPEDPKMELTKTAQVVTNNNGDCTIGAGDTVFYNFAVLNTGNVTLSNITVSDPLLDGISGSIGSLDPNISDASSISGFYIIEQADVIAGGVFNSAISNGTSPQGTPVSDISDDGDELVDTDLDSDSDPTNDSTFVRIEPDPSVNLAKQLYDVVELPNGDVALTFQIQYLNSGNTIMGPVEVFDPLEFLPAANPIDQSIEITINNIDAEAIDEGTIIISSIREKPQSTHKHDDDEQHHDGGDGPIALPAHDGYNGITNTEVFHDDFAIVNPGESFEILLTVEVDPDVLIDAFPADTSFNQALGIGHPTDFNGNVLVDPITDTTVPDAGDLSDNGSDPKSDNNEGGLDDPTPIFIPRVDITKEIIGAMASEDFESFDVLFEFVITNTGMTTLENICITDDMVNSYGDLFEGIPGPAEIITSTADVDPLPNLNYNGSSDIEVTDCSTGLLNLDQTFTMQQAASLLPGLQGLINEVEIEGVGDLGQGNTATAMSTDTVVVSGDCGTLSCPGSLNVTLDALTCTFSLTTDLISPSFQEGELIGIAIYSEDGSEYFGNLLTEEQVGQTFQYRVYNLCSGFFCWGNINLEQKTIPEPVQYDSLTLMCSEIPAEDELLTLERASEMIEAGCYPEISDLRITVDTLALDASCATSTVFREVTGKITLDGTTRQFVLFYQVVEATPITLNMINGPVGSGLSGFVQDSVLQLTCWDDIEPAGIAEKYGIPSAYPYVIKDSLMRDTIIERTMEVQDTFAKQLQINGLWVTFDVIEKRDSVYYDTLSIRTPTYLPIVDPRICNWSVKKTDSFFAGCLGDSSKIERTWNLLDWCFGSSAEIVQWINITDEPGPRLYDYLNYTVPISPWTCAASLDLPDLIEQEGCSNVRIEWRASAGHISDGVISDLWLYESPVEVIGTAITSCGIEKSDTFTIHVIDASPPIVLANDRVNLSLNSIRAEDISEGADNRSALKVESIDIGSHDTDCSEVTSCLIRKEDYDAGPVLLSNGDTLFINGEVAYIAVNECYYSEYTEEIFNKGEVVDEVIHRYVTCASEVKYCCEDIGDDNYVALLVTDGNGLTNLGWSQVNVEDKPIIQCVNRRFVVSCDDDYSVERLGQIPTFSNSCHPVTLDYEDQEEIDACGNGVVYRTWILDGNVVCTDQIILQTVPQFDPYTIQWPLHYNDELVEGINRECQVLLDDNGNTLFNNTYDEYGNIIGQTPIVEVVESSAQIQMMNSFTCELGDIPIVPTWCDTSCVLIEMSYEDNYVPVSESCGKLIRRWTIIDWCTYVPNETSPEDDGNDIYSDSFEAVDDTWLRDTDCQDCDHRTGPQENIYFRYNRVDRDGYYTFDQIIQVDDDTAPEIIVAESDTVLIIDGANTKFDTNENCLGDKIITASAVDSCGATVYDNPIWWWVEVRDSASNIILQTYSEQTSQLQVNAQSGAPGDVHYIEWTAHDACGNHNSKTTKVKYIDAKNPTPVCIAHITTTTMNTDGTATIWATDYDNGSFDNCSDVSVYFKNDQGDQVPSISFNCDTWSTVNGQSSIEEIQLWVGDESGNEAYCSITLRIQDNLDVCDDADSGSAAIISGEIRNEDLEMIEFAEVSVQENDKSMLTPQDGTYSFSDNTMNKEYTITSYRDGDYLNGVTAADLVKIQQHLLGINMLSSPYKIIAADVNNDQRVSTIDLVQLRKVILGLDDKFVSNTSWRFLDAYQVFENTLEPWPFTESLTIRNLDIDRYEEDFIGIKIGDVNNTAIPNSAKNGREDISTEVVVLIEEQRAELGDILIVPFTLEQPQLLEAYQFTMSHPGYILKSAYSGNSEKVEFARLEEDITTFVWHSSEPLPNDLMFTMELEVISDESTLSELSLNSSITDNLVFNQKGEISKFALKVGGNVQSDLYSLSQNEPNPFKNETSIEFYIGQSGDATFTVYDISGIKIFESENTYSKGSHSMTINRDDLRGATGVFYYQIASGEFTARKKMIVVR